MQVPSWYADGYEKAAEVDPVLASAYVKNTLVGDPLGDAAVAALDNYKQSDSHRLIEAGMNGDEATLREAPDALREFFRELDRPPPFEYDSKKSAPGTRVFYEYSDLFLAGLVLNTLASAFGEGQSKAFYITGRLTGKPRRIRQNARHLIEVTLPGGMDRQGDGWKLTVRIRLIHSQIRKMLLDSDDWDVPAEGMPLSMAQMAMGAIGFSSSVLDAGRKLGVTVTEEESDGYMHIWHYATWLLGVPEELLFTNEAEAVHLQKVALLCEPPQGEYASKLANEVIRFAPELFEVTKPAQQKRMVSTLYRTSRAMIGHEAANRLQFPKQTTVGALALLRMVRKAKITSSKVLPWKLPHTFNNFSDILQRAAYDEAGISYRMPDAIKDTASTPW